MSRPLRMGVVGIGHLGTIHLRNLLKLANVEVVGVFDSDPDRLHRAATSFPVRTYSSYKELIEDSEAIDIVTPTITHYALAMEAIECGRHLFIEKPVTKTVDEARQLLEAQQRHNVVIQVGHVERFNPAVQALMKASSPQPRYLEAHRLAPFRGRGIDVSVVLDLMIHDIDLALWWIDAPFKEVRARGVAVLTSHPDIASARLEFENGAVANLTASRISLKNERKVRLFQSSQYVSIDLLHHQTAIYRLIEDTPAHRSAYPLHRQMGGQLVVAHFPAVPPVDAIAEELRTFVDAVRRQAEPPVTLHDAYAAIAVAYEVLEEVRRHLD